MRMEKCNKCRGSGKMMVFSEEDWKSFMAWKRATDKQFVHDEAVHGKGFVAIGVDQMEDDYNEWKDYE